MAEDKMPLMTAIDKIFSSFVSVLRGHERYLPVLLFLLALVLFVSKSLYNIPVAIMAVLGVWQCIRNPRLPTDTPLIRSYLILFLCIWVPMLISLLDARSPAHTVQTVVPYLRYLFAGIYILNAPKPDKFLETVYLAIFILVSFWSLDAAIQYLSGSNLLGYPYERGHITGMFYPRNTIAHLLAALSPLYFESLRKYSRRHQWLWLLLVPLLAVILLSGRRASWIMFILAGIGYTCYLYQLGEFSARAKKGLLLIGLTITVTAVLIVATNKPLQRRLVVTAGLFSLDYQEIDLATASRLPIWETGLAVFRDNWINGIGPRGFRHVYTEYSREDDIWHLTGTTHPHQLILEVLAETGILGFAGLICFIVILWRLYRRLPDKRPVFPFALCVFIVLFPVNTSMAFYGSYWSSVIWCLLMLTYLSIRAYDKKAQI